MTYKSIAIDGPCGAGKSTIARALAEKLGYLYVDTGAIYRTVGLYMKRQGVDLRNEAAVAAHLEPVKLKMAYGEDGLQHMLLNGEDVTSAIRTHEISACASQVGAVPAVRAFLLEMQRQAAREQNVIMDGRDIGTTVLPEADLKIYLTAAPEERARRRHAELLARGEWQSFEQVYVDVLRRDRADSSRAVSPLRQAEDAVVVDTTDLSFPETLEKLAALAEERLS